MKLKQIAPFLTAAALCLGLAACSSETSGNSGKASADSGEKAKNTGITLTESWEFDSGFYPVVSTANASNYGITYWTHNFYDTLVKYNTDPDGDNWEQVKTAFVDGWAKQYAAVHNAD